MTLAERAQMGTQVRQEKARSRAQSVQEQLAAGECLKRAAWRAGVSYRTAKRYAAQGRG